MPLSPMCLCFPVPYKAACHQPVGSQPGQSSENLLCQKCPPNAPSFRANLSSIAYSLIVFHLRSEDKVGCPPAVLQGLKAFDSASK